MKLIDGIFRYGEMVAVDVDGKLFKRKVHYADGELFIDVNGQRISEKDFSSKMRFDKGAYDTAYNRAKRERFTASVPKKQGESWRHFAAEKNMSMNEFIIYCVEKEINS